MTPLTLAILLATTLVTATVSGVFGMAGGLLLMGVLAAVVPVATAMVLHGFIQVVANFSRAALLRGHVDWRLVGRYAIGTGASLLLLAAIAWRPGPALVYLLLGSTAMLVWIPARVVEIDVGRPLQAELCGFLVQALNTIAGVAGPLLDLFFVKTLLPRQVVVATKAATQVLAHVVKIAFWGWPLLDLLGDPARRAGLQLPAPWVFAAVVPLSLLGTWLGGRMLERMTDADFRGWTKWLVTAIGLVYLARGVAKVL